MSHDNLPVRDPELGHVVANPGLEEHVAAVRAGGLDLLTIDEAQFFGSALVDAVQRFAGLGLIVIVAGLDVTFEARPFEPMPSLAALAESVTRLTAATCGRVAAANWRPGTTARRSRFRRAVAALAVPMVAVTPSGLAVVAESSIVSSSKSRAMSAGAATSTGTSPQ